MQERVDWYNAAIGRLDEVDGVDCRICKNKGFINRLIFANGFWNEELRPCECMNSRGTKAMAQESGMQSILQRYSFEGWKADTDLQKYMLQKAMGFLNERDKWFYVGGQSGCGKTHICTAICGKLIEQHKSVKYMLWRDEIARIKQNATDDAEYAKLMDSLKRPDVLYIDDLFKTGRAYNSSTFSPTAADINAAFEIINYRYNDPRKITIISTEITIKDMEIVDEAIAGRIAERCGADYCLNIAKDPKKNYRLHGGV